MERKCVSNQAVSRKVMTFPSHALSLSMKFFNRNSLRVHIRCHSGDSDVRHERVMDQSVGRGTHEPANNVTGSSDEREDEMWENTSPCLFRENHV